MRVYAIPTRSRWLLPAALALLSAGVSYGQTTFNYNVQARTFRACRLLLPYQSSGGWVVQPGDTRSLIFEGMRRYPGKPAGWDLVNPLAATNPANGVQRLKSDPRYWEVALDPRPALAPASASAPNKNFNGPQLDNFDLIYIYANDGTNNGTGTGFDINLLRPEWRASLMRAVYEGAVVWVDANRGPNATGTNNSKVLQFAPPGPLEAAGKPFDFYCGGQGAGTYRRISNAVGPFPWARDRLLNCPFVLQDVADIQYLGIYPRAVNTSGLPPTNGAMAATWDNMELDDLSGILQPVVAVGGGGVWEGVNIAVGRYGAGAIVLSAGDVGYDVVNWWYYAQRNSPLRWEAADCRFAWNVAASAGAFRQAAGNVAGQAASVTPTPPPLSINWQYPDRFETTLCGPIVSTPVVNRGMVYAVSLPANGEPAQLMCFDADPARDLNGDGRADDGLPDYSLGRSYDMVWRQSLGAGWTPRTSAPAVTSLYGANGGSDVVLVSLTREAPSNGDAGQVRAYEAKTQALLWTYDVSPYGTGGQVVDISSPTVYRGFVFVLASEYDSGADTAGGAECAYGRAHAFELNWTTTGGLGWVYPDASTDPNGDGETTGGSPTDHANPEGQKSLPSFQDPAWVAGIAPYGTPRPLPPFPTPQPLAFQPTGPLANSGISTLLQFSTPRSFEWLASATQAKLAAGYGGSDYLLIPTPRDSSRNDLLNTRAFRVCLPRATSPLAADTTVTNAGLVVRRPDVVDPAPADPLNPIAITAKIEPEPLTPTLAKLWQDPADGHVYAYLNSGNAREYLLPSMAAVPTGIQDWLTLGLGTTIRIDYQITAPATTASVTATLPGPVYSVTQHPLAQRRVASRAATQGNGVAATDTSENNNGSLNWGSVTVKRGTPAVDVALPVPGAVSSRSIGAGAANWSFYPHRALSDGVAPLGTPAVDTPRVQLSKGGFAVERGNGTVLGAVTSALNPNYSNFIPRAVVPQVLGLNSQPVLRVQLGGPDGTELLAGAPVIVRTVNNKWDASADPVNAAVDVPATVTDAKHEATRTNGQTETQKRRTIYEVDSHSRTITFAADEAGWVDDQTDDVDDTIGPLWGKPVWVTYTLNDGSAQVVDELHVLPDILRFQYSPGIVRLNHNVVRRGSINFTLPNGVPLVPEAITPAPGVPVSLDEVPSTVNATVDSTYYSFVKTGVDWSSGYLPRGIVDVRNLRIRPGAATITREQLLPGSDLMVSYEYYDEATHTTVTAHERHQLPVNFGASMSSPVLADRALHVGTEGYLPTARRGLAALLTTPDPNSASGFNALRKSLLSVVVDPITQIVRGALGQTAIPEATTYGEAGGADLGTPVATAPVGVDDGGVLVGSRMMRRLSQVCLGATGQPMYQGEGMGFVSRLTPERTLICDNTRLVEVIGQKPSWVCAGTTSPQYHESVNPARGADDLKVIPFSRPAKATYLDNGNILVADTGNNRVVEIDRQGRQVWPLDTNGYDYYTSVSTLNPDLLLDRPSDCYRYYETYNDAVTPDSISTHGDLLPLGVGPGGNPLGTVMHTVVADPGHNRVVDVISTVDAGGTQRHTVRVLTPRAVRLAAQNRMGSLSYTRAQPIFDPTNQTVIGYLCVAANLHQLVVVEAGTRRVDPPYNSTPTGGGSTWAWLAWLYDRNPNALATDPDLIAFTGTPTNPLIFRNIRDVELTREGAQVYLTVTCGQFAGRLQTAVGGNRPAHHLAAQGAGVFEYCMDVTGARARIPAVDDASAAPVVTLDDPIWWFTRTNYLYSGGARRSLTNIRYFDAGETPDPDATKGHYLETVWNPVSAMRLPVDRRPVLLGAGFRRQARHLVTNYVEIVQNLSRENVYDTEAPASLFSSVFAVNTDDRYDARPENDLHDLDRREVIPDPNDADWTDPFNQPAFADRR